MDETLRLLEAMLFTAGEPLSERTLARRLPAGSDVTGLLTRLAADYAGRGIRLVRAGETWAFMTAPDLGERLAAEGSREVKLSRAAVETLAIIAYHQPVTRAEIEQIRAVQVSKGTLDVLFEHGWITPKGRRDSPGRPLTWGTTDAFLRHFALASLKELPDVAELKAAGLLDAAPAALLALPAADGDASAR